MSLPALREPGRDRHRREPAHRDRRGDRPAARRRRRRRPAALLVAARRRAAVGRRPGRRRALVDELRAAGGRRRAPRRPTWPTRTAPAALVAAARDAFGHVDVAGRQPRPQQRRRPWSTSPPPSSTSAYAVNTRATLLLVTGVRRAARRPPGRPACCCSPRASTTARCPASCPTSRRRPRCTSSRRSLAVAPDAPRGITVNCVDPGPNDTGYADDATRAGRGRRQPGRALEHARRRRPPGRLAGQRRRRLGHRPGHRLRRRLVGPLTSPAMTQSWRPGLVEPDGPGRHTERRPATIDQSARQIRATHTEGT